MGDSYDGRSKLFGEQVPASNPTSYQLSVETLVDSIIAFQRDIQEVGANQNVTSFNQRCEDLATPHSFFPPQFDSGSSITGGGKGLGLKPTLEVNADGLCL